jgi:hypothetical protein
MLCSRLNLTIPKQTAKQNRKYESIRIVENPKKELEIKEIESEFQGKIIFF